MNNECGFVAACLPSIKAHIRLAITENECFRNEGDINKCLLKNVDKYLSSVGNILSIKELKYDRSMFSSYREKFLNVFLSQDFLKDIKIVIDSAGYQIQLGYFRKEDIPEYISDYYSYFISNSHTDIHRAFNVDVAPGQNWCPFKSYDELYELNKYSLDEALKMNDDAIKKMIYIHHFRTPSILKNFRKLIFEHDYINKFDNYATGGLVSFSKGGDMPPYVLYVLPLIDILYSAINKKQTKFSFHVLGASDWKDILAHKFFERHVKELFDIDLNITYDSSTFFQTFCLGKTFVFPSDDKILRKIILRSGYGINFIPEFSNGLSYSDIFYKCCNDVVREDNLPIIDSITHPIYNENNTFSNMIYSYAILHSLHVYNTVDRWCSDFVEETYKYFDPTDNSNDFIIRVEEFLFRLQGLERINKKVINAKAHSISNSLLLMNKFKKDMKLVIDECEFVVDKYLSVDELDVNNRDLDMFHVESVKEKKKKKIYGKYKIDEVERF